MESRDWSSVVCSSDLALNIKNESTNIGIGGNGRGSGGRNITMNVTLNNNFSLAQKGMDIQNIVEQVCTQISLRLGDTIVASQ